MKRKMSHVLTITSILLACAAGNAVAATPDIRPGLWQMTMRTSGQGQVPIPQEELDRLNPQQRAAMEKALINRPHTLVYKSCVTQNQLDKAQGNFFKKNGNMNCERKLSRSTAHSVVGTFHCTSPALQQSGTFDTELSDSTHMTATVTMIERAGSRTMTTKDRMSGHWISASCGNVH